MAKTDEIFINALTSLLVENWTKENFKESKVKRVKGRFAKKDSENTNYSLTDLLDKEIKNLKGQKAIAFLMKEKSGYIKNAFIREDIGAIALLWGDEKRGLCHILKRRKEQNLNVNDFLSDLTDVIEKGQFVKINDKGRFEIFYNGKMAVIEPEITNGQLTFLLTAFKRRKA